jgi:N-methylhydantoinase B
MTSVNVVELELLNHALASVADEMMITTNRTGFSPAVQYLMDFSAALFNAEGEMIVQGVATPHHLGAMPGAIRAVLETFPNPAPGDAYIINDPFLGGIHLPDIFMFTPAFAGSRLIGYACLMTHHVDVGGRVPGSMAADSRSIHEEGLRLPPVRLYDAGRRNEDVMRIIRANVRLPNIVMGDLSAQLSACRTGERGLAVLVERYGATTFAELTRGLFDQAEHAIRELVRSMPDGVAEFTDYVDDDGVSDHALRIQVRLTVVGDELEVDFTGSSPQTAGAVNSITALTSVCTVLRCLLPVAAPNNAGAFRPLRVYAPEGSFLNPRYPAAVAARGPTAYRVDDAVFGALAQLLPGRIPAASDGGNTSVRIAGKRADGSSFILPEIICGSRGGRSTKDGLEGACNPQQNISNTPVEVVESEYPVRVVEYAFIPDTGGAGRFRGGLAIAREWEFLTDVTLQMRSDRREHTPWGLEEGENGTGSDCILDPGRADEQRLPAKFVREVAEGSRFRHVIAAGGGYGPPVLRDSNAIAADLEDGKVTPEYVRVHYPQFQKVR